MLEPLHPKHELLDGNLTAFRAAYYSTSSSESPFRPEHGMFAVRTYLFLVLLLSSVVTPAIDEILCGHEGFPRPNPRDCQTIINMIPSGDYH